MPEQFDEINGQIAVLNPTNEKENFADKWQEKPRRKEKFLHWLVQVRADLEQLLEAVDSDELNGLLESRFGESIVEKATSKMSGAVGPALIIQNKTTPPHVEIHSPNRPWADIH